MKVCATTFSSPGVKGCDYVAIDVQILTSQGVHRMVRSSKLKEITRFSRVKRVLTETITKPHQASYAYYLKTPPPIAALSVQDAAITGERKSLHGYVTERVLRWAQAE
jgi:hypothetical protein